MKLGVVSDIHGNRIALEAVVADGRAEGVEAWWVLGDLVAIGPDPIGPLDARIELDDGTRILGVHASPGLDDGEGITPHRPDDSLRAALDAADADIVIAGHTHQPTDRQVGSIRAVNGGSVSNPITDDLRAGYVVIHGDRHEHCLEHRRVAYDTDAFLRSLACSGHPEHDFIASFQRGEQFRHPAQRPGAPVITD